MNESKPDKSKGAKDNPVEKVNGSEIFVRLSHWNNDKRVDKVNKRLLPGTFTTTLKDYKECNKTRDDPIERYALPTNDPILWAFHIQPKNTDTLQSGIVQPAFGRRGGGEEAYFDKGTSYGTFISQTPY